MFLCVVVMSLCVFIVTLHSLVSAREAQTKITEHALPLLRMSHFFSEEVSRYLLLVEKVSHPEAKISVAQAAQLGIDLQLSENLIKAKLEKVPLIQSDSSSVVNIATIFNEMSKAAEVLSQLALYQVPEQKAQVREKLDLIEVALTDIRRAAKVYIATSRNKAKGTTDAVLTIRENVRVIDEIFGYYLHGIDLQDIKLLKSRYISAIDGATEQLNRIDDETLKQFFAQKIAILFEQGTNGTGFFNSVFLLAEHKQRIALLIDENRRKEQMINFALGSFLQSVGDEADQDLLRFENIVSNNFTLVWFGMTISVLLSLCLVAFYIYPRISKRLTSLALSTNKVASGDYSVEIDVRGNDEISAMAQALDGFRIALIANEEAESERLNEGQVIDEVYRITTDTIISSEQKIVKLLALGGAYFRLSFGVVNHVHCGENKMRSLWSTSDVDQHSISEDVGGYFLRTFSAKAVTAWQNNEVNATQSERFKESGVQAYIGMMLEVDGEPYGILCFFDHECRSKPFSSREKTFVGLIAQGIVNEISRAKRLEEKDKFIGQLSDSNEELARFAYVCSHDLQEPLRMIRSFSEKLMQHLEGRFDDDEKGQKYFRFIIDGAERSQNLIADILAYSSLDRVEKQFLPVSVSKLLEAISRDLESTISDKGGRLTYDPLPDVIGNHSQLYQLFQNLISNGFKYHRQGEVPQVHVGVMDSGDRWVFSVQDNGIGIEERYSDKIFEVFQRLHRQSQYTGTGVGLSICKKVVKRHGGEIWVKSTKDVGTLFYFTLMKAGGGVT